MESGLVRSPAPTRELVKFKGTVAVGAAHVWVLTGEAPAFVKAEHGKN